MIAASDSNTPLTKEAVFRIMGKYYGNAYYRAAIRVGTSAHDLSIIKELLDEINALGYTFADLHRLCDTEDTRFVPILLKHLPELENRDWEHRGRFLVFSFFCTVFSQHREPSPVLYISC